MATDSGFSRPTLATIIDRIKADLNANLRNGDARIARTLPYVMAVVLAGAVHLLYGTLSYLSRQLFPDTADGPYLVRHAKWRGVAPKLATVATDGTVGITGTNGSTLAAGAQLRRTDGVLYVTTEAATIAGGVAVVPAACTTPGAAGNAETGTALAFVSPAAGIASAAAVADPFTLGADDEATEDLRTRLLEFMAAPPQGGSLADWRNWTKATPGVSVRNVWVTPWAAGPGTIVVRFSVNGTGVDQIPSGGQVAAVLAYLDTVRPAQSILYVAAPTGQPVTMTMHVEPDTTEVRESVTAALTQLFADAAGPGVTIPNSVVRNAISDADGETSHTLVDIDGGDPLAPIVGGATSLPYLSTVTWS